MVDRWIVCWFSRAILNSCCSRSLASEKTSDLATCILLLVSRMYHSLHICDKDKSFRFEQIFIIVVTLRHIVTDHTLRLHWFLIKSTVLIKKIVDCNIIVCMNIHNEFCFITLKQDGLMYLEALGENWIENFFIFKWLFKFTFLILSELYYLILDAKLLINQIEVFFFFLESL